MPRPSPQALDDAYRTIAAEFIAGATAPLTPATVRDYFSVHAWIVTDCLAVAAARLLTQPPADQPMEE